MLRALHLDKADLLVACQRRLFRLITFSADTRTGATVRWLWNLGNASDPGVMETPCFVEMSEMRAKVEAKGLWDSHTRARGASFIHGQTVLPSVRLENFSVRGG